MNSISFPKMFTTSTTKTVKDITATLQDLQLFILSEKGEFISDPDYGIRLKRFYFEQNNQILRDILIDEIYSQLPIFHPQLTVNRKDIKIVNKNEKCYIEIKAVNKVDFSTNMYAIALFQEKGE